MLLTTTNIIKGKSIREYKGIVTADVIYGTHVGRDILASCRDVFGGRSTTYEQQGSMLMVNVAGTEVVM